MEKSDLLVEKQTFTSAALDANKKIRGDFGLFGRCKTFAYVLGSTRKSTLRTSGYYISSSFQGTQQLEETITPLKARCFHLGILFY